MSALGFVFQGGTQLRQHPAHHSAFFRFIFKESSRIFFEKYLQTKKLHLKYLVFLKPLKCGV